jgi:hypothetical protein
MNAIRLVNGHFDGEVESLPTPPERLHKKLPHGDWVDSATGNPVTHDVYRLTTDAVTAKRIYNCVEHAIERSTWLKLQALKNPV